MASQATHPALADTVDLLDRAVACIDQARRLPSKRDPADEADVDARLESAIDAVDTVSRRLLAFAAYPVSNAE